MWSHSCLSSRPPTLSPVHFVTQTRDTFLWLLASVPAVPSLERTAFPPFGGQEHLIFKTSLHWVASSGSPSHPYTHPAPDRTFFSKAQALSLSPQSPQGLTDTP